MSYVLTAIISMIFGAGIMACFKVSGGCSEQERATQARQDAYEAGYKAGDRDGYRAGIRRMSALRKDRVDVAPGNDSIRPEKRAENRTAEVPHD